MYYSCNENSFPLTQKKLTIWMDFIVALWLVNVKYSVFQWHEKLKIIKAFNHQSILLFPYWCLNNKGVNWKCSLLKGMTEKKNPGLRNKTKLNWSTYLINIYFPLLKTSTTSSKRFRKITCQGNKFQFLKQTAKKKHFVIIDEYFQK